MFRSFCSGLLDDPRYHGTICNPDICFIGRNAPSHGSNSHTKMQAGGSLSASSFEPPSPTQQEPPFGWGVAGPGAPLTHSILLDCTCAACFQLVCGIACHETF